MRETKREGVSASGQSKEEMSNLKVILKRKVISNNQSNERK